MAASPSSTSAVVAEAILEDQIADLWPEYPCLYDVRSPEFKNREMRERALEELAEKLGQTGKSNSIEFVDSTVKCLSDY